MSLAPGPVPHYKNLDKSAKIHLLVLHFVPITNVSAVNISVSAKLLQL